MFDYIPVLMRSRLFDGVEEEDLVVMLDCMEAKIRRYRKGEYVFRQGEMLDAIMVLEEGCLHVQRDDYWGNRSIISVVGVSELFGEAYAVPGSGPLQNDVVAVEDSVVIAFDVRRVLTTCSSACVFHSMAVNNLFGAIAEKNRQLVQKMDHISRRSTREKLISYLSSEAVRTGSGSFEIPLNRQQLADFLSVDRSAMSAELGRMRDEGLIQFEKNHFTLL